MDYTVIRDNIGGLVMRIKTYPFVNDFLIENEHLLLREEAINQLILFNAHIKKKEPIGEGLICGTVNDERDEVVLIFFNALPYNLLIYPVNKHIDVSGINRLVEYLIENKTNIKGINANKAICDIFINYYKELTGAEFSMHLAMDIMELRELNPIDLAPGYFRATTNEDLELVVNWSIKFMKEAMDEEFNREAACEKMKDRLKVGGMYLFEDINHKAVAMAAATRQLTNGVSISWVYTDEIKRGKGYGEAVVYNLSKLYLEKGNKFCCLFVDKTNPISNRVYKKMGYRIIEDNYDYRIVK